ncbi:hypothetical protein Tco_0618261 [Tanacetum coccineum]
MADEMLRQRCTSGDEHQYHIDQMKNFLKSDIVWESRKEILISPYPQKTTPLVHSCQKDPEAPALSRIFKTLLKQKEPGKPKEEIYSNLKIVQVIKTYWELGHEHKFITEIVARRANACIVPDYADTGLLWSLSVFIRSSVIWERVHDFQLGIESYQQKVNLTAPTITFLGIEEHDMFSIIYELCIGIITRLVERENGMDMFKKDLPKMKSNTLKLFEEEIEERLKHRRQMRR